jgi:hypothetical protein
LKETAALPIDPCFNLWSRRIMRRNPSQHQIQPDESAAPLQTNGIKPNTGIKPSNLLLL